MTRRRPSQDEAPGQDSFLDIVANLVGILIILIMLVGVQAKDALVAAVQSEQSDAEQEEKIDVESPRRAASDVAADDRRLARQVQTQQATIDLRRLERNEINVMVARLKQEVARRREKLDADRRDQFDLTRDLTEAEQQFEDLKRSQQVVENSIAPPTVLTHIPTPLAKTVFGREIHFRLQGGRLAYVPWDELVEKLKAEAPQKQWKLKNVPRITETAGPIQGFWMKYTLARGKFVAQTSQGTVAREGFQLEGFVLIPTGENLGEPLAAALNDGSRFNQFLSKLPTDQTTVTVWVYPDSYEQFRVLKEHLLKRGLLTAGRPMPAGHPIGGAPGGSRSAAQ